MCVFVGGKGFTYLTPSAASANISLKGISVASLSNPDKDGWLTKQGGSIKTWKRRWCVLKDGSIFYFKNQKEQSPKGTIDLEKTSVLSGETSLTKRKYAFEVKTAQRTFVIFADNEASKREWMAAINAAIQNLRLSPGLQSTPSGANTSSSAPNGELDKPAKDGPKPNEPTPTSGEGDRFPAGVEKTPNSLPKPVATVEKTLPKLVAGGKGGAVSARTQLSMAKSCIPFLQEDESKVLEFWQIWSESIPTSEDLAGGMAIEFHVFTSATMQKLTWRTAGPQNIFIQRMVDFFWNVGAPESEIDRLNDVGALINPIKIGSWIDMSGKGGMDGGWYFPVDIPLSLALEAADSGDPSIKVKEWAVKHDLDKVYSVGRDMGAAPPRQTEFRIRLDGPFSTQLEQALDAFETFGFPPLQDNALEILKKSGPASSTPLSLSIVTSSEGFVRLGILQPNPTTDTVLSLCDICSANKDDLAAFEGALGSEGPAFAEYQYLMKGFGYSVYKEGFDIIFHYFVGEERATDD